MAIYLALVLVPMAMAIGTSTTNLNQFRPNFDFIGLANYVDLFQDAEFRQSLSNTTILAAIVTIVPCSVGLAVAVLLDKKGWVFNALRAGFFIPVVLSAVVVSVIWGVILTDEGLLNQVLISIGIVDPPGWLSDPDLALYTVASIICWQSLGVTIVIYLAGLQGIPRDLLEAADQPICPLQVAQDHLRTFQRGVCEALEIGSLHLAAAEQMRDSACFLGQV